MLGEIVGARTKHAYHRLTSMMSVKNGVTESTYIAETLIPLVAIGLPLSPVAAGPAAPLFNAPPVFTIDTATGATNNLHDLLSPWDFLGYGLLAVVLAAVIAYPFSMNYARSAASWVVRRLSQEAIIACTPESSSWRTTPPLSSFRNSSREPLCNSWPRICSAGADVPTHHRGGLKLISAVQSVRYRARREGSACSRHAIGW